jgi:hypothetical protein
MWELVLKPRGGEKVASNEDIRRVIEEIEKMRKQVRNSKLKLKRRVKKLEKTFDPLEKGRIELEIEMLRGKIRRWEIVETKLNISILKGALSEGKLKDEVDWSKAGKAWKERTEVIKAELIEDYIRKHPGATFHDMTVEFGYRPSGFLNRLEKKKRVYSLIDLKDGKTKHFYLRKRRH